MASKENSIPKATHTGELKIAGLSIPCAVLEDGTRVITQRGMFVALGMHKNPSRGQKSIADKPGFLAANNLIPFIAEDLTRSWTPIPFKLPKGSGGYKGNIAFGYRAEILPLVCHVYLDAADAKKLTVHQEHIAKAAKILHRGFAVVGIVALVDEATGFQEVRDRHALEKILEKWISKELLPWTRTFPEEFYRRMFELNNWPYDPSSVKRPQLIGKWTNDYVYERLETGVLDQLRKHTPRDEKGRLKNRLHQHLTIDLGHPKLREHLAGVIALMRIAPNWARFKSMMNRAYPKKGATLELDLKDES